MDDDLTELDYGDEDEDTLDPVLDATTSDDQDASSEPTSTPEVTRPEAVCESLRAALESGHLAQAYLLTGSVRESCTQVAQWLSQYLYCTSDTKPCGTCDACRKILRNLNPDVHWFYPEKKSRIIDVKMMRERILPQVQQTSLSGGWKVIVIAWADQMREDTANTFLKTLEEPPPRTLFLLLAESINDVLPTIISRCQILDTGARHTLAEPWRSQVIEQLTSYPGSGSPIAAMALSSAFIATLGELSTAAEKLVKAESKETADDVRRDSEQLKAQIEARYKEFRQDFILLLHHWMLDLLRLRAANHDAAITFEAQRDFLAERANHYTLAQLFENLKMLDDFVSQLERNINEGQILPYWCDRFFL